MVIFLLVLFCISRCRFFRATAEKQSASYENNQQGNKAYRHIQNDV
ncbi:hypothetical protein [Salipaludibacillus sp. LMS25]